MKRPITLTAFILAGAVLVGCNQSEPGGKPNKPNDRMSIPGNEKTGSNKNTFTMKAPVLSTKIKQGDRQTVKLSIDRGSEFKSDVALKAETPKGVSVEFEPKMIKASDAESVSATVTVAKDAAVGDHTIVVTGTPGSGTPTSVDFKVTVEKKGE